MSDDFEPDKSAEDMVDDELSRWCEMAQRSRNVDDTYTKMKTVLLGLACWAFVWIGLIAMLHATVCVLFPDTVAAVNVGVTIVVVLFPILFAVITNVLGDDDE